MHATIGAAGRLVRLRQEELLARSAARDPSGSRTPSTTGSLTRREREVARLLAVRLTNREIAEALFISQGTVGTHVEHILGKLGVSSRRDPALTALLLEAS